MTVLPGGHALRTGTKLTMTVARWQSSAKGRGSRTNATTWPAAR